MQRSRWVHALLIIVLCLGTLCQALRASAQQGPPVRQNVRLAILDLFTEVKGTYHLSSDVRGEVELDPALKTFEARLTSILQQVHATHRIESGVYSIFHDDRKVDVRGALRALFRSVSVSYSIGPDVQGLVKVDSNPGRFEDKLWALLIQVHATYEIEGGVFVIYMRGHGH